MTVDKDQLILDHERAEKYANKFMATLQAEITARGLILNGAIEEFNDFRNLPKDEGSLGAAVWEFAFAALSTAVPLFRIGPYIQKTHERATVALAAAKQAGLKATKAKVVKHGTKAIQNAGKAGEKINDAKDKKEKIEQSAGKLAAKLGPNANGSAALEKHKTRKPIMDLIDELNKAIAAWDIATEAELEEFGNRLKGIPPQKQVSLLEYMQELLPPIPKLFTPAELDEIWTRYLWYLIGRYVQDNVVHLHKVIWNQRGGGPVWGPDGKPKTEEEYVGLNGAQERKIVELFGASATRGHYFSENYILYVEWFYRRHVTRSKWVQTL